MGILFPVEARFLARSTLLGVFFLLVAGSDPDLINGTLFDENIREDRNAAEIFGAAHTDVY